MVTAVRLQAVWDGPSVLHGIVAETAEIRAVAAIKITRRRRYQSQHMTVIAGWHIIDIPVIVARL